MIFEQSLLPKKTNHNFVGTTKLKVISSGSDGGGLGREQGVVCMSGLGVIIKAFQLNNVFFSKIASKIVLLSRLYKSEVLQVRYKLLTTVLTNIKLNGRSSTQIWRRERLLEVACLVLWGAYPRVYSY